MLPTLSDELLRATLVDIFDGEFPEEYPIPEDTRAKEMQLFSLMRHAAAKTICDGIVNCLIVTDSPEANIQLTRIHEHIFASEHDSIIFKSSELNTPDLQGTQRSPPFGDAKHSQLPLRNAHAT